MDGKALSEGVPFAFVVVSDDRRFGWWPSHLAKVGSFGRLRRWAVRVAMRQRWSGVSLDDGWISLKLLPRGGDFSE